MRPLTDRAAIGFTVKSGWASVVLLAGPVSSPRVMDSRRIELSDPAAPESRQPYHAGFGTARSAGRDLSRLVTSVRRFGKQSVARVIRDYRAMGRELHGAAAVVGSVTDPERIANAHIRIHALEGRLFRKIVEDGARRSRLTCSIVRERDLYSIADRLLSQRERELRVTLTALGASVSGPWRAENKAAALAAWLVLAGHPRASS